jgi:hypothetical protein
MDLTFPRTANFTGAFLNAMLTLGAGFIARDVLPSVANDGDTACMIQHYIALLSSRALVLLKTMSH